jgi:hypothetical protein
MLTEALVTIPAKISDMPKARTIGQAVGAGSCKVAGVACGASIGNTDFKAIILSLLQRPMT